MPGIAWGGGMGSIVKGGIQEKSPPVLFLKNHWIQPNGTYFQICMHNIGQQPLEFKNAIYQNECANFSSYLNLLHVPVIAQYQLDNSEERRMGVIIF